MLRWVLLLLLLLAGSAQAAVTFDAVGEGTGTTALSWSHTPAVATPEGVIVFCFNNTNADVFTGATYDGEALTAVGSITLGTGEVGHAEVFWLGSGVNTTSPATVVCTVSTGSTEKHGVSYTVQAVGDLQLAGTTGFCTLAQTTGADPSCSITGITGASWAAGGAHKGNNTEGATTAGAGFTVPATQAGSHDYVSQTTATEYATTQQSSGDWTVAFTSVTDDTALIGIAIQQITPDAITGTIIMLEGD